jgi:hypothetical protein
LQLAHRLSVTGGLSVRVSRPSERIGTRILGFICFFSTFLLRFLFKAR